MLISDIVGSSGSAQDRRRLLAAAVKNHKNDPFDVLVGDWMSEANMTFNATKNHKGTLFIYHTCTDICLPGI